MLISLGSLSRYWKIRPTGVVHVGAHLAEEANGYARYNFGAVLWVEANPELAHHLADRIDLPSSVIQGLVWGESGIEKTFNIANNGESSSVFELGTHSADYPEVHVVSEIVLETKTLAELIPEDKVCDFLNLDIQGSEYEALCGLGERIEKFNFVYAEVSRVPLYVGIKQIGEIDILMANHGFDRACVAWSNSGWGDALYINKTWIRARHRWAISYQAKKTLFFFFLRFREFLGLTFIRPAFIRAISAKLNQNKAR